MKTLKKRGGIKEIYEKEMRKYIKNKHCSYFEKQWNIGKEKYGENQIIKTKNRYSVSWII